MEKNSEQVVPKPEKTKWWIIIGLSKAKFIWHGVILFLEFASFTVLVYHLLPNNLAEDMKRDGIAALILLGSALIISLTLLFFYAFYFDRQKENALLQQKVIRKILKTKL